MSGAKLLLGAAFGLAFLVVSLAHVETAAEAAAEANRQQVRKTLNAPQT